jgi:hypothetical protein
MTVSLEKLVEDAIEGYIFTSCKDYGNSREDFDVEYVKYLLIEKLVGETMEEQYPRGQYLG